MNRLFAERKVFYILPGGRAVSTRLATGTAMGGDIATEESTGFSQLVVLVLWLT